MKKIFILPLIFCLSCTTVLWQELWDIKKGMSYDEVVQIIDSDEYGDGIEVINDISDDTYDLSTNLPKNSKILLTQKYYTKDVSINNTYYVFYFKDDKLIYWGMVHEFARHKNPELNKVAEETSAIIKEKYE